MSRRRPKPGAVSLVRVFFVVQIQPALRPPQTHWMCCPPASQEQLAGRQSREASALIHGPFFLHALIKCLNSLNLLGAFKEALLHIVERVADSRASTWLRGAMRVIG